jgi:hypothetical protein
VATVCGLPTSALAANVEVVVDSTDVTLESVGDGSHTAEVRLANLRDSAVMVAAGLTDDPGCAVDPEPDAVESGRSVAITLTLDSGCTVDGGANIELRLTPDVQPSTYVVKAVPAPAPTGTEIEWSILGWSALIALGVGLLAVGVVGGPIFWHNPKSRPEKLGLTTKLTSLGTNWSFTDNWVNTVTAGSGLLFTLLATSSLLEAVLGSAPKAGLTLMAVTGAIAAVLVGISPILVKVLGDDVAIPTIGGTLLAALVTLIGSIGQITVVTWQAADLVTSWVSYPIGVLGVLVGATVFFYAIRALRQYIADGVKVLERTYPDVMKAAFVVKDAIRKAAGAPAEGEADDGPAITAPSAPVPSGNSML